MSPALELVAQQIILNGRPAIRLTHGPYLVGYGYYRTSADAVRAILAAGLNPADLIVRETAEGT